MEKYLYQDLYQLEEKHWWHIAKRQAIDHLVKRYLKVTPAKILDIGCGTGQNINYLSKFGQVYGVDNSPQAIKYCKSRNLLNVRLANSDQTGYPKSTFDMITLLDVLEHLEEDQTLKEIYRILKPKGIFILTVPALTILWSQWDIVLHHRRRYTKTSLTEVLKKNNFKIKKIYYLYSFLFLPALVIRFTKSFFYKDFYPSDFRLSWPVINHLGLLLAKIEQLILKIYQPPIGTSIVCVAEKK